MDWEFRSLGGFIKYAILFSSSRPTAGTLETSYRKSKVWFPKVSLRLNVFDRLQKMCKSGHSSMFFVHTTKDNKGKDWVHKNRIRGNGA